MEYKQEEWIRGRYGFSAPCPMRQGLQSLSFLNMQVERSLPESLRSGGKVRSLPIFLHKFFVDYVH